MSRPLDARERRAQHEARELAERHGASASSAAPSARPPKASTDPRAARAKRGLGRVVRAAIISLAVLYVGGFALVTWFTTTRVATRWRPAAMSQRDAANSAHARAASRHRLPVDPSITPEAAGIALYALRTELRRAVGITLKEPPPLPDIPWRGIPLPLDVFPEKVASPSNATGLPRSVEFLTLMRRPLSAQQRQALRVVGAASVWSEFDKVARAKSIDVIGARFELPFGESARGWFVPLPYYTGLRDYIHATYMRAGWHLSEGRRDSAEFAMRSLLSFGVALVENGSSRSEHQAGTTLARAGIDGLVRFSELMNDPRGAALAAAAKAAEQGALSDAMYAPLPRGDLATTQRRLIAMLAAPLTPRAMKPEAVRTLHLTSCGSLAGVLRGPSAEVRAAVAAMRQEFVRLPSDEAMMQLIEREMSQPFPANVGSFGPAGQTARSLSRLFFNPRLGTCAIVAMGGFGLMR